LDDPTQAKPITIDQTHLPAPKRNEFLSTVLINYLIQQSINIKNDQWAMFSSSLFLSVAERFLQKDWNDTNCNITHYKNFQKKYQYYSFGEFRFFSLVWSGYHFYVISLNFNSKDPNKHIFTDVKVYDSLEDGTCQERFHSCRLLVDTATISFNLFLQKFTK
jgi:hypothetical protein